MRIIFAGTPEFAAAHLQELLHTEHEIIAVYTQPDRPAGRGKKLNASAVKVLAQAHNIPVFQPETLKTDLAVEEMAQLNADLMIVVAYGLILPSAILQTPKLGCINVHGSILPKWRGAAPIQRAVWAGDKQTGVTIMQMDEGLDTGDILSIETIDILSTDTSASLYDKLAQLGPKALVNTVQKLKDITPTPQNNEDATYAAKLSKQEAYLDWQLSAQQLEQNVRGFNPWPVAWFSYNETPIKVWESDIETQTASDALATTPGEILSFDKQGLKVATASGTLIIKTIQVAGKKAQPVNQIVNGQPKMFTIGTILE